MSKTALETMRDAEASLQRLLDCDDIEISHGHGSNFVSIYTAKAGQTTTNSQHDNRVQIGDIIAEAVRSLADVIVDRAKKIARQRIDDARNAAIAEAKQTMADIDQARMVEQIPSS